MTTSDIYQLKWHSHSSHLNGSVAALLRSERFTDVVLCTVDGSQIPAHKFILSSCSIYLCNLFEGQRSVTRMGGMLYVVLPSEISTKALKILVEYMYKGETTVSNEVLDVVLKAGEVLKIRGLWKALDESGNDPVDKLPQATKTNLNTIVSTSTTKPVDTPETAQAQVQVQPKITIRKDEKILKTYTPMQTQGVNRPMFIGPPKLVFIKTTEGGAQATLRPGGPKGQTILVTQAPSADNATVAATKAKEKDLETSTPRVLRKQAEIKQIKRLRSSTTSDESKDNGKDDEEPAEEPLKKTSKSTSESSEVQIKEEPDWDVASNEEEERSIAEMYQAEMTVKDEPEEVDIEEDSLLYSPLSCELCAEVFSLPAAWVRHVEAHAAEPSRSHARKRKARSASDDTEETTALLRCDLCQKHFPNPAEWVRHVQSTHTESELAISNNSAPPKRHNRFTEGAQNKTCKQCDKIFPSHASMVIHMRTHTGERPFVCGLCNKGFNVKSNLLRHLRTLHDFEGTEEEERESSPGPSDVKAET